MLFELTTDGNVVYSVVVFTLAFGDVMVLLVCAFVWMVLFTVDCVVGLEFAVCSMVVEAVVGESVGRVAFV